MPKMKTNRTAYKKYRVNAKGKPKSYRANTSHNTGKKSAKRMRQLRHGQMVDATSMENISGQLPYMKCCK
ncbi:MAG: 50S ribosomal protein L35 [Oligoflexia bacterium]|nr:50S ribosomal protein L35 [Oligoflexia bacterium]